MEPYKDNGQDLDQWLIRLVSNIVAIAPSDRAQRDITIDHFLQAIYALPNLYRPKTPTHCSSAIDHDIVRDRLLREKVIPQVRAKIHEFYPTGNYLAPTLGKWVNEKLRLKWHCLDEYQTRKPSVALDDCLNGMDQRIAWQAYKDHPTLSNLEQIIAAEQAQNAPPSVPMPILSETTAAIARIIGDTPTQRFCNYIANDPDGLLRAHSVPNAPDCTYQILIQRLYLQDPPTTKKAIAETYGIKYQALNAHYNRHIDPKFIQRLILENGFLQPCDQDKIQQYIHHDPDRLLQECSMNKLPQIHAQYVAQQRLSICCETAPHSFEQIVDTAIATYSLKPKALTPEKLEKFWVNSALPLVAQATLRVLAYDQEV